MYDFLILKRIKLYTKLSRFVASRLSLQNISRTPLLLELHSNHTYYVPLGLVLLFLYSKENVRSSSTETNRKDEDDASSLWDIFLRLIGNYSKIEEKKKKGVTDIPPVRISLLLLQLPPFHLAQYIARYALNGISLVQYL